MTIHPEIAMYWDRLQESVDNLLATLDGFSGDDLNWKPTPNGNSLYVLATHVMGNIQYSMLGLFCRQERTRDRDAEFVAAGESADDLLAFWDDLKARIETALADLTPDALTDTYVFGRLGEITGQVLLLRVATHACEHVGHAEVARDLLRAR